MSGLLNALDPEKAPATYEEAMEYAEKLSALKDADGNSVYGLGQTTGAVPVSGGAVLSMLFSHGGGIMDASGNVDVINAGNKATLEAHLILISEDSPNKEAAAEFIKFATSPAQMAKYYSITPFLLSRASQVDAAPDYKSDPGIVPVLNYAETIRSVEKHAEMENVFLALTTAAQSVSVGGMSSDEALANLDKELKTLLK